MTERTLRSPEFQKELDNLVIAAGIMTALENDPDIRYHVADCYLDYDQGWMWTTILKKDFRETGILRSCQAITPKQWKEIVSLESKSDLLDYMKSFINN